MYLSANKDCKKENLQIMKPIKLRNKKMANFKTKRNTQVIVAIWINVKMSQMRLKKAF